MSQSQGLVLVSVSAMRVGWGRGIYTGSVFTGEHGGVFLSVEGGCIYCLGDYCGGFGDTKIGRKCSAAFWISYFIM